ncbi:MAG: energy transducer TonB [Sphingobacteriales bacterium]|nr:energy transducer TonB [Sphingobacteriales bacterium]
MKKATISLFTLLLCMSLIAQQKEFEGIIIYKVETKSKSELISEKALKSMTALGNDMTIFIKKGNYKQVSGILTTYYITKDQKVYYKFNSLDTLYYLGYSSDTTKVKKITRHDEERNIAGFECKSITIESGGDARKYYYAPDLYMNPDYDKNNTIERYDVYTKETSSIYLGYLQENKNYSISGTCKKLQQTDVIDSTFELPHLPQKKFSIEELITPPEFTRSGGFTKYLQTNLDMEIGAKHLKIPKGEEKVSQTVIVQFLINEFGRISTAEVVNKKEVHPKLAEEALRVVNGSPPWKPATIYGSEKTIFWQKVPITFQVSK